MRAGYDASFAVLKERVEIVGDPRPSVTRPPRHDDDELGPSIVRLRLEGVVLAGLTLRGLYVGRSELRGVSFGDSDLRLSAFNWSDLIDCDFTAADLGGADLRACRFVRCTFRGADLSGADLRMSSFDGSTFEGAVMQGARLHRRARILGFFRAGRAQAGMVLTARQRHEAEWCSDAPEPGGG
jgi:uncharacterized protein YjbI with pentapeptide repeats